MTNRIAKVLMADRVTPQSTTGVSPSELLQGRRICTCLDLLKPRVSEHVEQRQLQQKLSHDSSARRMSFTNETQCMRRTLVLDKSGYQQLFKKSLDQSRFWLNFRMVV